MRRSSATPGVSLGREPLKPRWASCLHQLTSSKNLVKSYAVNFGISQDILLVVLDLFQGIVATGLLDSRPFLNGELKAPAAKSKDGEEQASRNSPWDIQLPGSAPGRCPPQRRGVAEVRPRRSARIPVAQGPRPRPALSHQPGGRVTDGQVLIG